MLLVAIALVGGLVAVGSAKAVGQKAPPLCALGQTSSKAKLCKSNPAFGKGACAQFVPAVQSLLGATPTPGPNRSGGAQNGISCFFIVAGKIQAFGLTIYKGPTVKSVYDQGYQQDTTDSADIQCDNKTPPFAMNAPQPLSGLGDAAYSWDQCTPHGQYDNTSVAARRGNVYYRAYGQHPYTNPSVDQLAGFIRLLMAKYH
jgi:hypothetical protein